MSHAFLGNVDDIIPRSYVGEIVALYLFLGTRILSFFFVDLAYFVSYLVQRGNSMSKNNSPTYTIFPILVVLFVVFSGI